MASGNTYSNPLTITYLFPSRNFASGSATQGIKGPPGMRGRVRNIQVNQCTVVFNAVTTPARIQLGISGNLTKFANLSLGTLAAGATLSADPVPASASDADILADQEVVVTNVANTGGTPTGTAAYQVAIDWFD